jgi:hypothetical protein
LAEQDSPEAVAVIAEIQSLYGTHAAMRAAVAIAITKLDVQKDSKLPDVTVYTELLKNYPEVLPLLRRAVALCLPQWSIQNTELVRQQNDYLTNPSGD